MDSKNIVLAGLAVGAGAVHTPVQVQKLFFLIDRNIPKLVEGPHFSFRPYNYGPFDEAVYRALEQLACEGLVELVPDYKWTSYRLTAEGQRRGEQLLASLPSDAVEYIRRVSDFVRSLSFTQLVSSIYNAYPDMRENSVFQQ
ncbi:MAG: hypothetical protein ACRDGM_02265 [bacterium]